MTSTSSCGCSSWCRTTTGDGVLSPQARAMIDATVENTSRDVPIWEHKVYVEQAPLVPDDGPIRALRTWARQFYPEPDRTDQAKR